MNKNNHTVAVLGASTKTDRYSFKATELLQEYGYNTIPINTAGSEICGLQSVCSIADITSRIDTLTMYVNPAISDKLGEVILTAEPKRVIFNPGTENQDLAEKLSEQGTEVIEACTLVMLKTNQF